MPGPIYRAGDLRERVTVQRRATTDDGFGNNVSEWTKLRDDIPAAISPMRGGEAVREQRLAAIAAFEIVVRSDSFTRTIKASDRLVNARSGQAYDIKSALNLDERDFWLTLTCTAVV